MYGALGQIQPVCIGAIKNAACDRIVSHAALDRFTEFLVSRRPFGLLSYVVVTRILRTTVRRPGRPGDRAETRAGLVALILARAATAVGASALVARIARRRAALPIAPIFFAATTAATATAVERFRLVAVFFAARYETAVEWPEEFLEFAIAARIAAIAAFATTSTSRLRTAATAAARVVLNRRSCIRYENGRNYCNQSRSLSHRNCSRRANDRNCRRSCTNRSRSSRGGRSSYRRIVRRCNSRPRRPRRGPP